MLSYTGSFRAAELHAAMPRIARPRPQHITTFDSLTHISAGIQMSIIQRGTVFQTDFEQTKLRLCLSSHQTPTAIGLSSPDFTNSPSYPYSIGVSGSKVKNKVKKKVKTYPVLTPSSNPQKVTIWNCIL